ncbi:hypothetical protein K502DRAFT_104209 [Neoconidiobolus thromboides FSU 785]|nr:hypothetical protein K502DRAFT_104209 [Neoconidiobolus thromboides FSU 785]
MKSFKWTGRKVIPEKYPGKNDEGPPDLRKDLNRSNTSNVATLKEKEHKKISLERSATTGKIGGNEMIKSFKQFFDKFSSNKTKSPSKQDQSDVQLTCTNMNSAPLVHRVVIESPEVNLMPLVIQSSDSLLDDIKTSEKLNSPSSAKNNNYSNENNNESPDYFFIPPKSVRRPNLTKTSNSTTSLAHSTKSGKFTRSEPNSAGLPPKNINSLEINQLVNDLAAYSQMDHIPDSPYTIPDSHSADMKSIHSGNNYSNKEGDIIDSHNSDVNGSHSNKGNDIYNSAFNQIISSYTTPVYNLIFQGPVRQVISGSAWKSRFLFLFEHLLVIAKSMESSDSPDFNISEAYFEIKKVISLDVINAVTARNQSNKEKSSENKYHPIILSAIRRFEIDPNAAISYLIARGLLHLEPPSISKFIYFTPELSRLQLTNYVGQTNNHAILISFLNHFNWTGLRLDLALRVLSTCLVLKLGTNSSELILDKFATRWHQANRSTTNFRSELTLLLVVSLLEIDDKGKGSLSKELFLTNVRKFDSTNTLPEHLLIDMYDSISESPLIVNNESQEKIELKIDNNFSRKIIVNEHSDSIEITLSAPCPGLRLLAHGEDIKCDPPEIVFDSNPTQTFKIIGDTPGKKSLMFIPIGQHSSKLRFIPSLPIIVEQNFMKHAFSLSFTNSGGNKNDELNHPDIIMPNYDVVNSEDLKNQPPNNNNIQQNVKKYLFALETHENLISWTCSFERTIDMLQENQDEALQKIEDELCSTLDNSEDAFEEADKIQKSRAKDLSVALTQHFTPHFNSVLYYPELIAIASKKEF